MRYLSEDQIRPLLRYEALIPAVQQALIDLSSGKIRQPLRSILHVPEHQGIFALMPAVAGDLMSTKLVTVYEANAGIPTHQAVIQLLSARTGEPLLAMDGRLITEMRTAAVSAVAVELLTPPGAKTLAILGSGVQARSHLHALRRVRTFRDIRVWSRTPDHARRFASEHGIQACDTAESAAHSADVVVSVSSTHQPLVRAAWLGPQTLVCAVSAVGPNRRELDDAAMAAPVIVESREAALRESGDILDSGAAVHAELGELLAGTRPLPPPEDRVVFKSLGVAATDLAAAALVWSQWQAQS